MEGDLKKTIEEGNSSSSTPSRKRNVPDEVRVSCILRISGCSVQQQTRKSNY